jgi:hypothetical protein
MTVMCYCGINAQSSVDKDDSLFHIGTHFKRYAALGLCLDGDGVKTQIVGFFIWSYCIQGK